MTLDQKVSQQLGTMALEILRLQSIIEELTAKLQEVDRSKGTDKAESSQ